MPNKDLIKKDILILMLATCAFWPRSALGQESEVMSLNSGSPCIPWESEPERLVVGHICVVAAIQGDERPRYVQNLASVTYKFLFSPSGLALVIEPAELEALRYDQGKRDQLLGQLTEDRLAIWHNDAIYWWHWLESVNRRWAKKSEE
jgi:hypothetical protein